MTDRARKLTGLPIPKALLFTLAAVAATACGPLVEFGGGGEPASLYALTAAQNITPAETFPETTLMIEEPSTSAAFDAKGIALMPETRELRYYAGAQWIDRAPRMLQTLLVTSFEETGAFRDVGSEAMALAASYRLDTALRAFNTDYTAGGAPVVRIAIMAKLFSARPLDLAGSKLIRVEEPASSDRMEAIIEAFDRANRQAISDLVNWTIETVASAQKPQTTEP